MERRLENKPAARRKLGRSEITEILERNVSLYRNEEQFVSYLVELAIYLLEYEYDWAESQADAPRLGERPNETPVEPAIEREAKLLLTKVIAPPKNGRRRANCPYCGITIAGDVVQCPSCHNLTK